MESCHATRPARCSQGSDPWAAPRGTRVSTGTSTGRSITAAGGAAEEAYLGVDSNHLAVLPDVLQQFIQTPAMRRADGHMVRHLVDDVQLLDGQLVDLVQHIDAGDVLAIACRVRVSQHSERGEGGEDRDKDGDNRRVLLRKQSDGIDQ